MNDEYKEAEKSAKLKELRQKIQVGLDEIANGEVVPLDIDKILELGMMTREKLRQMIQVGLDQADRGEFSTLTMDEIKAEARREWEAKRKGNGDDVEDWSCS